MKIRLILLALVALACSSCGVRISDGYYYRGSHGHHSSHGHGDSHHGGHHHSHCR